MFIFSCGRCAERRLPARRHGNAPQTPNRRRPATSDGYARAAAGAWKVPGAQLKDGHLAYQVWNPHTYKKLSRFAGIGQYEVLEYGIESCMVKLDCEQIHKYQKSALKVLPI